MTKRAPDPGCGDLPSRDGRSPAGGIAGRQERQHLEASGTGFTCSRCGHCCRNLVDAYRGCVSDADLARWREAGREDVLAFVETLDLGHGNLLHTAWIDPATGDDVEACPWLVEMPDAAGYACGIESLKPDHCRNYPEHRSHGLQTGCRGFTPQHS